MAPCVPSSAVLSPGLGRPCLDPWMTRSLVQVEGLQVKHMCTAEPYPAGPQLRPGSGQAGRRSLALTCPLVCALVLAAAWETSSVLPQGPRLRRSPFLCSYSPRLRRPPTPALPQPEARDPLFPQGPRLGDHLTRCSRRARGLGRPPPPRSRRAQGLGDHLIPPPPTARGPETKQETWLWPWCG